MLAVARVLAFLSGSAVVLLTVASAIKTVVVPRAEPVWLSRAVFVSLRKPFDMRVRRAASWEAADRIMSRFAPFALLTLPLVWLAIVLAGFMPIYWALGVGWPRDAFEESGSSLLTLGFASDRHGPVIAATFVQATLGLGLIALLISFLPTMYQLFSRREVLVSQLDVRAGTPPTPVALSGGPSGSAGSRSWTASGSTGNAGSPRSRSRTRPIWRSRSSAVRTTDARGSPPLGRCSTALHCGRRRSTCRLRGRPSSAASRVLGAPAHRQCLRHPIRS